MFAVYAAGINRDDPLSVLGVGELPVPSTPDDWATVTVRAASLNHHDLWALKGQALREEQVPMILGTDAAGMSEKELKYGRAWLLAQLKRTRLNMVCANVWDKVTKKPLVQPYVLVKKGNVTIGVLGLTSDKVDLGPSRDSLTLEDPVVAAQRTVAEMRKKGATVDRKSTHLNSSHT